MTTIKFKIIDSVAVAMANKDKRTTRKLRKELSRAIFNIQKIIDFSDKVQNAYFWTPPLTSAQRRAREDALSFSCSFSSEFVSFELEQKVQMSARNVYVIKTYTINGEETNLRRVKTLLGEMKSLLKIFEEPSEFEAYLSKKDRKLLEEELAAA